MSALESRQTPTQETDADICWVCLDEATAERPLSRPCMCPRSVHRDCLARWCLHQSGKSEETVCRFCQSSLPDWKASLLGPEEDEPRREPLIAAVVWQNTVYKIAIQPGPEGKAEFKKTVNRLFGLSLGSRYECTFECKLKEDKLSLKGLNSYEAATRCAARSSRINVPCAVETAETGAPGGPEGEVYTGFRVGSM